MGYFYLHTIGLVNTSVIMVLNTFQLKLGNNKVNDIYNKQSYMYIVASIIGTKIHVYFDICP